MTGYGTNKSCDTYHVCNPKACKVTEQCDAQLMNWVKKSVTEGINVFSDFELSLDLGGLNMNQRTGIRHD